MSQDRAIQVVQHGTLLQPQGLHHPLHPFDKPAPRDAVAAEGILSPDNARSQDPLRMVVRGLDPLDRREQPQRRLQRQYVGAQGRRLGIRARATLLQNPLEFARNPVHPSLQGRAVDLAVAERPPVGEQAVNHFQTGSANCVSGSSSIDQLLKITFQVSPANLTQFQREFAGCRHSSDRYRRFPGASRPATPEDLGSCVA